MFFISMIAQTNNKSPSGTTYLRPKSRLSIMEDLKRQVMDGAVKLCLSHQLKQSEIYEMIRDALIETVKELPKQRILYNDCYGGFGLSKEFNAFYLKDEHDSIHKKDYESRKNALPYVIPFAEYVIKSVSTNHPYLRDVLYMFHKYKLNDVFSGISQILKTEKDLQLMEENANNLRQYLENDPVTTGSPSPISHWVLLFKPNFQRYNPQDLRDLLVKYDNGELQKEYTDKITQLQHNIVSLISYEWFQQMKAFYVDHEKQKEEASKQSFHSRIHDKRPFVKLLNKYGIDHNETWSYQSYYNTTAIFFMLCLYGLVTHTYNKEQYDKNKVYDIFHDEFTVIDDKVLTCAKETFGLLCASSTYAHLKIAEVSALLEWDIYEYDGLEKVVTV